MVPAYTPIASVTSSPFSRWKLRPPVNMCSQSWRATGIGAMKSAITVSAVRCGYFAMLSAARKPQRSDTLRNRGDAARETQNVTCGMMSAAPRLPRIARPTASRPRMDDGSAMARLPWGTCSLYRTNRARGSADNTGLVVLVFLRAGPYHPPRERVNPLPKASPAKSD